MEIRELTAQEVQEVSGGLTLSEAGLAIIAIGLSGGPATGIFGLAVGGSLLYVNHVVNNP